jgi:ketosteroid isomerase-like protein
MGTQTPDKREPKEFWQAAPSGWKAKGAVDPTKEESGINAAEKQFRAASAKLGLAKALEQFGDPSLRVWKNGFSPTMERKQSVMEAAPFKEKGEPMKTEVAKSGDLGYDYGKWESTEGSDKGYYLHVWRKNAAGAWKIVARVEHVLKP